MANYHFDASNFKNELWINKKAVFNKPKSVDVEFETAGAFDWLIADANGKEVKTLRHSNEHGGWTSINLPSLGLYDNYSIGFRKANGAAKMVVKQGDVTYGS